MARGIPRMPIHYALDHIPVNARSAVHGRSSQEPAGPRIRLQHVTQEILPKGHFKEDLFSRTLSRPSLNLSIWSLSSSTMS